MNIDEAKAKIRRIVESNTTYSQSHQLADPEPKINKEALIEDLQFFVEKLLSGK